MPNEVFLSHSSVDRAFVTQLAKVMRGHGIPVWYSETNIRGAQQWHDEIGAALRRCDWLILVLSPNAVASKWVKRELLFCLQEDRFDGRIIQIINKTCEHDDLSWTLSQLQMVDFRNHFDTACRELLRTWGIGYAPA